MYISTCRVESYEVYGRKNSITKYKRSSTDARRTPVQSKYSFSSRLPNHEHLILFASSIAKKIMLYGRHKRETAVSLCSYLYYQQRERFSKRCSSKNGTSTRTSLDTSTSTHGVSPYSRTHLDCIKKLLKQNLLFIYLLPTLLPVESNCMIKSVKCSIQHLVFFMILT